MTHELKKFIEKMQKEGHGDKRIRNDMLEAGWHPDYVSQIPHMGDGEHKRKPKIRGILTGRRFASSKKPGLKEGGRRMHMSRFMPIIAGGLVLIVGSLLAFAYSVGWFGAQEAVQETDDTVPTEKLVYDFPQVLGDTGEGTCPPQGTFDMQNGQTIGGNGPFPRFHCAIDERFRLSVQWEQDGENPGDPTLGAYHIILSDSNLEGSMELFTHQGLLDPTGEREMLTLKRIGNWYLEIAWRSGGTAVEETRSAKIVDLADRRVIADVNGFTTSIVVWQGGRQTTVALVTDLTCRQDAWDEIAVTGMTRNGEAFSALEPPYRFLVRAGEWAGSGPCPGMPVFSKPAYTDGFESIAFSAGILGTLTFDVVSGEMRFDRQLMDGQPVTGEILAIAWEEKPDAMTYEEAFAPFIEANLLDVAFRYPEPLEPWQGDGIICEGSACVYELFGQLPGADDLLNPKVIKLGVAEGGRYDGSTLFLVNEDHSLIPVNAHRLRVLLTPQGDIVVLGRYSNSLTGSVALWERDYQRDYLALDSVAAIPDLTPPSTITIPKSPVKLSFKISPHLTLREWARSKRVLFEDPTWGPVYENLSTNDIGIELKDGTVQLYRLDTSFFVETDDPDSLKLRYALLAIRDADGGNVAPAGHFYEMGATYPYSCEGGDGTFTVDQPKPGLLEAFAKTGDELTLFRYSDSLDLAGSLGTPADFFTRGTIRFHQENPDGTYEQFLAIEPIFVWQDPFERYVQIRNVLLRSEVGCEGGTAVSPLSPGSGS